MDAEHTAPSDPSTIGRYTVDSPFAAGGMASVHLGRAAGPMGFARTVAVKRLLPALASDPTVTARFFDEARLASRVRHANVVPTLDVVVHEGDLLIVMEYVAGLSLATVLAQPEVAFGSREAARLPLPIVSALMTDILQGLHAAHTATNETGRRLSLVHRDVSPHNVLVGSDGVARVIDFGIATASERVQQPKETSVRGKLGYIAPEQLRGEGVTYAADVYGASVILWELLAHRRLATSDADAFVERVLLGDHDGPRKHSPDVPSALEDLVMKGLDAAPARRFASAHDMAVALASVCPRASALDVAAWLEEVAGEPLRQRADDVVRFESMPERRLSCVRPSALGLVAYDPTAQVTERLPPEPSPRLPEGDGGARPRARTPRRRSLVGAGLTAVGAAALAVVLARPFERAPRADPFAANESRAATSASAPASASSAAPASDATARGARAVDDDDDDRRERSPPTRARAPATHRGPTAPGGPPSVASHAAPPSSATTCKVPFYFDTDGTKHYRAECIR